MNKESEATKLIGDENAVVYQTSVFMVVASLFFIFLAYNLDVWPLDELIGRLMMQLVCFW